MSRRSQKSSNVKAAIAGSKEVAAELSGQTADATKFGMEEKANRNGNSRSRTRKDRKPADSMRSSSSGIDRGGRRTEFAHLQLGGTFRTPEVIKRPLYSGREQTTDYLFERDFTARPAVYVYPLSEISWTFQSGDTPTPQEGALGNRVTTMFNDILRTLQAQRLVNISSVALANPTPAPAFPVSYVPSSMQALLRLYCFGAVIVRLLESLLIAGDANYAISKISDAVMQNLQQLEAVSRRLRGFRVPPLLIELIDRVSGVKKLDDYMPLMVYGNVFQILGIQQDLTVPGNVLTLIGEAETFLTQCMTPTLSGANMANDFQLIWSLFANAYGVSEWPTKGVSTDPAEYWQGFGTAAVWLDTTATAHWFEVPNTSVVDMVPVLIPRAADDEGAKFLQSLVGYQRYGTDVNPILATSNPNLVGLFDMQAAVKPVVANAAYSLGYYNQNGTFTNSQQQGGAPRNLTWTNSDTSAWYFASPADAEIITAAMYTTDQRVPYEFDILKNRRVDLIDATDNFLEKMFLLSVK